MSGTDLSGEEATGDGLGEPRPPASSTPAPPTYDLEDLLARLTRYNLHAEVGFGPPAGREAW